MLAPCRAPPPVNTRGDLTRKKQFRDCEIVCVRERARARERRARRRAPCAGTRRFLTREAPLVNTRETSLVKTRDTSLVKTCDTSLITARDTSLVKTRKTSLVKTRETSLFKTMRNIRGMRLLQGCCKEHGPTSAEACTRSVERAWHT